MKTALSQRDVRVALVGGGMFGGDVVLRSIEDFERCGLAPYLGRVGLDHRARDVAAVRLRLVAIGTRTETTARRLCDGYRQRLDGSVPSPYWGEAPWCDIFRRHDVDILYIATPDSLHHAPALHALRAGAHVVVEKPLALGLGEAREIAATARERGLVAGVDMHKRYDPCHRFIFEKLVPQIGTPLYGRAVLEEPLEVSTQTFQWAASSNPFSYVGVHWLDLFAHYLGRRAVSLHAVGQKELLVRWDQEGGSRPIDTFDAMQVSVEYEGGLRVYYVNNWINPRDFEGPVNQEMEIVGTRGRIEFDQQYRGLRAAIAGAGSRTYNPHFTADVRRLGDRSLAYDGYGKDSITAITERAVEVVLGLADLEAIRGTYPDAESSVETVALIEAAAQVAARNLAHLRAGRGAPVTARISERSFEVVDPISPTT
jgi:predicted dehydrogenase